MPLCIGPCALYVSCIIYTYLWMRIDSWENSVYHGIRDPINLVDLALPFVNFFINWRSFLLPLSSVSFFFIITCENNSPSKPPHKAYDTTNIKTYIPFILVSLRPQLGTMEWSLTVFPTVLLLILTTLSTCQYPSYQHWVERTRSTCETMDF